MLPDRRKQYKQWHDTKNVRMVQTIQYWPCGNRSYGTEHAVLTIRYSTMLYTYHAVLTMQCWTCGTRSCMRCWYRLSIKVSLKSTPSDAVSLRYWKISNKNLTNELARICPSSLTLQHFPLFLSNWWILDLNIFYQVLAANFLADWWVGVDNIMLPPPIYYIFVYLSINIYFVSTSKTIDTCIFLTPWLSSAFHPYNK